MIDAVTRKLDPEAPYDVDGERARHGRVTAKALVALLADPYFDLGPPKSTGREHFGASFADRVIVLAGAGNDAVTTATALTVEAVGRALERWTPAAPEDELVISGGGARNPALVEQLAARVRPRPVRRFDELFFDGEAKEAVAFAFLGLQTILGRPGNLPGATGARGERILGHITPA